MERLDEQQKRIIALDGRHCEAALMRADTADKRGDEIDADYWRNSAAMWSASAFRWLAL